MRMTYVLIFLPGRKYNRGNDGHYRAAITAETTRDRCSQAVSQMQLVDESARQIQLISESDTADELKDAAESQEQMQLVI